MPAHSEFASSEMVYNKISCLLQEDETTREGTRENNKNGAKLTILFPGAPCFILRSLDQKESDGLWERELVPLRSKEIGARQPPCSIFIA